jgi:hypothetical protein
MTRTFELRTVLTLDADAVDEEQFQEFRTAILNGELQREMMAEPDKGLRIKKCTMTITEIKKP